MLRVLFLALDIDLTKDRGDTIHATSLARALARLGHEVHLVVGAGPPSPFDGVAVSVRPAGGDLRIARFTSNIAKTTGAQVIYERRFTPKISAATSLLSGIPYVVEINGIVEEESAMQGRPLSRSPSGRVKSALRKVLLRRADGIVTVTRGLRDAVTKLYRIPERNVTIVPNGVDPELFQPHDTGDARGRAGIGPGQWLCFVGNLVRWQGVHVLVEALTLIGPEAKLVLVGSGPDQGLLTARAMALNVLSRIDFRGPQPHEAIPDFICAADVCVAPFTGERNLISGVSALKVYEYLACGRPIVASAVPGVREIIEEYGSGVAVTPNDPARLARGIEEVLGDTVFRMRAERASESIRRRYAWETTALGVTQFLERVVED